MEITNTDIEIGGFTSCIFSSFVNVLWWTTHSKNWHHLMGQVLSNHNGPSVFNNLFTDSAIIETTFPFFNFLLRVIIFIWFYSILVSASLNYLNFTLLPIQVSDLARSNIHQDINWENNNKILDGWSRLVMIPVSHTGGREFKSLPIHSLQSRNYFLDTEFIVWLSIFKTE